MTLFLYFSRISMGQYCLKMLWKVRSLEERYNGGFTIYGKFSIEEGHSFLLLPSPYGQNLPPGTSFAPSRVSYFGATTFVKTVGDLTIWLAENGEKHYLGCCCESSRKQKPYSWARDSVFSSQKVRTFPVIPNLQP